MSQANKIVKFFESYEDMEDFVGKNCYRVFCQTNISNEYSEWRDDAIHNGIVRILERRDYINNSVDKVGVVGQIVRSATFDFVSRMIFADGAHFQRSEGESIQQVDIPPQLAEREKYESSSISLSISDLEKIFRQSPSKHIRNQSSVMSGLIMLRLRGYSYQAIANETGRPYDSVRVYCSRARSALREYLENSF